MPNYSCPAITQVAAYSRNQRTTSSGSTTAGTISAQLMTVLGPPSAPAVGEARAVAPLVTCAYASQVMEDLHASRRCVRLTLRGSARPPGETWLMHRLLAAAKAGARSILAPAFAGRDTETPLIVLWVPVQGTSSIRTCPVLRQWTLIQIDSQTRRPARQ